MENEKLLKSYERILISKKGRWGSKLSWDDALS